MRTLELNLDRWLCKQPPVTQDLLLPWDEAWMRYTDKRLRSGLSVRGGHTFWSAFDANLKIKKNRLRTLSCNLAPATTSGINVCPFHTKGCFGGCVMLGGQLGMNMNVAICRTQFLYEDYVAAVSLMFWEAAAQIGGKFPLAGRPDAAADLRWERFAPCLFELPWQLYDYTKHPMLAKSPRRKHLPDNYHLTFSISEDTKDWQIHETMASGTNCAVVLRTEKHVIPDEYMGYPTIDGDKSDYRPDDAPGHIIVLSHKGKAKKDKTGFVREMP